MGSTGVSARSVSNTGTPNSSAETASLPETIDFNEPKDVEAVIKSDGVEMGGTIGRVLSS